MTFDGISVRAFVLEDVVSVRAPAHAAGVVDVVVTNPDGQAKRLASGYTYVTPQSLGFDFNGRWIGIADGRIPETLAEIGFTIENNTLVRVSCGDETWHLSPAPPVAPGEFAVERAGIRVSGTMTETAEATGTIAVASCGETWVARKQ